VKTKLFFGLTVTMMALNHLMSAQAPAFRWAKGIGGPAFESGTSITVDASGNIYTTGSFSGTADFDPGTGIFNLSASGYCDIFISKLDSTGNFVWAKVIGGSTTGYDIGYSLALDVSGNVYTTGVFTGTVDFDPGTGTFNLISAGDNDIFILKLDASGNFIWAKSMGGISPDWGCSLALDASGNACVTGYFAGTADFDPGAGTYNLTSAGSNDIFISKIDPSGNFVWAKAIGGASNDMGASIGIDASGNVCTTGLFTGAIDFDPGAGVSNLTSTGTQDVFISKLDAFGNFVWAKRVGGTAQQVGCSIALDASGDVYTMGYFTGIVDFDPGPGVFNLTSGFTFTPAANNRFVLKLDFSGNFVWAKVMGGVAIELDHTMALDAWGNIYTTGCFRGMHDFDPGPGTFYLSTADSNDIFISKLDNSGNLIWAKAIGASSDEIGFSITSDAFGNVYTTGYYMRTVDFDPGPAQSNLVTSGGADIFILKLTDCTQPSSPTDVTSLNNKIICKNEAAILSASGTGTVNWFTSSISTVVIGSGGVLNTPALNIGTHTYFAETHGCINSLRTAITVTVDACLGLEDDASNSDSILMIYPNPTNGLLNVLLQNVSGWAYLKITNSIGQVTMEKSFENKDHLNVDISHQPNGIYSVEVIRNGMAARTKIIKQ
jgi:hypothetical protein